jgi:hypothetical protein
VIYITAPKTGYEPIRGIFLVPKKSQQWIIKFPAYGGTGLIYNNLV